MSCIICGNYLSGIQKPKMSVKIQQASSFEVLVDFLDQTNLKQHISELEREDKIRIHQAKRLLSSCGADEFALLPPIARDYIDLSNYSPALNISEDIDDCICSYCLKDGLIFKNILENESIRRERIVESKRKELDSLTSNFDDNVPLSLADIDRIISLQNKLFEISQKLSRELRILSEEEKRLEKEEHEFENNLYTLLKDINSSQESCLQHFSFIGKLRNQVKRHSALTKIFQLSHAMYDIFQISYEVDENNIKCGTINSCRLGWVEYKPRSLADNVTGEGGWLKSPSQEVSSTRKSSSWSEINTALGFVTQLLLIIGASQFYSGQFKLNFVGCSSEISTQGRTYPLYFTHNIGSLSSGDDKSYKEKVSDFAKAITFLTLHSREILDNALKSDCGKRLHLEGSVYNIRAAEKDKDKAYVGIYSVDVSGLLMNISENSRRTKAAEWTKAMYCLLSNLQALLLWWATEERSINSNLY